MSQLRKILGISLIVGLIGFGGTACSSSENKGLVEESSGGHKDIQIKEEIPVNYSFIYDQEVDVDPATIEAKIKKIYQYFSHIGIEFESVTYSLTTSTWIDRIGNVVFLDYANMSDVELVATILRYKYSDTLHSGLMYGMAYDITEKLGLNPENVDSVESDKIVDLWDHVAYDYPGFNTYLSTAEMINLNKFLAIDTYKYILDKYGMEEVKSLLDSSSNLEGSIKLSEHMIDYGKSLTGSDDLSDLRTLGVYSQQTNKDTLYFVKDNIEWKMNLINSDIASDLMASANESIDQFYDYIEIVYDEMERLEKEMGAEGANLPDFTVYLYESTHRSTHAGSYAIVGFINLYSIVAFSHEYVHYIDYALGNADPFSFRHEMRAEYYSKDFELKRVNFDNNLENRREIIRRKILENLKVDVMEEIETFTGREYSYIDYYNMFSDLYINLEMENGYEMPNVYIADTTIGYPTFYWISIINFMVYEYGLETIDTVILHDELPDGSTKTLEEVVEEWLVYLENYSEEDYGRYY